jgi:hypothetical protein
LALHREQCTESVRLVAANRDSMAVTLVGVVIPEKFIQVTPIFRRTNMATYVVLANFTDQGVKTAKDSPKRAEAFKQMAKTFGMTVKEISGRRDDMTLW